MSSSRITDYSKGKAQANTAADARLHENIQEYGNSLEYLSSIGVTGAPSMTAQQPQPTVLTRGYLQSMHTTNLIQPFGCLLAVNDKTFKVVAYSENAPEMLPMVSHVRTRAGDRVALGLGTDVRMIFTDGAAALSKAFGYGGNISVLNPILVHCKASGNPFYALVHKVTQAFIIDLEPVMPYDAPTTAATGQLQFYNLAAKTVAKLQSLLEGSMEKLCNTMVQELFNLTGFDRVMAYRLHDDEHGEVIAEVARPGLEPYLGLHYPATDIPQTARLLFIKNMVHMICDCRAKHVKVVQDEQLEPLSLCGSTLRAPHSCHQQYMENMNSVASLVIAITAKEVDEEAESSASSQTSKRNKLWGLIVCHHASPIYVRVPLRYACKFITQVFGDHISKQLELERHILYKSILRTHTLLCDRLLQGDPLGIVSGSPNMLNLIKSDGAALLYENRVYCIGVTPTSSEVYDIVAWVNTSFPDSAGFCTDSFCDAMFRGALAFGQVCGMAAVRITSTFVLLWFRYHSDSVLHWAGEKHEPGEMDDGKKMHPRSSFKAFKEAVKRNSLPWKDIEIQAIHSLQLILRNIFCKDKEVLSIANAIHTKLCSIENEGIQELVAVSIEIVQLIEAATVPVFAVGVHGLVEEWNTKLAELTGLPIIEAIGKDLLIVVEESSVDVVRRMWRLGLQGKTEQNVHIKMKTHASRKNCGPVSLLANACLIRDLRGNVVRVCFIAQDLSLNNEKIITNKFVRINCGGTSVQNPRSFSPPIFGTDAAGLCCEWNQAMVELSGWMKAEVINKMLLGEVFGVQEACCKFRNQEAFVNFGIALNNAMGGQECEDIEFSFFSRSNTYVECFLGTSKKTNLEGIVTRIFCFLQPASPDLQHIIHVKRLAEQAATKRRKTFAFVKRQVKIPLSGISFTRNMLEGSDLGDEQKKSLSTIVQCERQLNKVLDDTDIDLVIDGFPDIEMSEFTLHEVLNASMSQVISRSNEKNVEIYTDFSGGMMSETLYGDGLRLQQVLSDCLSASLNFTPDGGDIAVSASLTKHNFVQSVQRVLLEFRITLSGDGLPEELIMQMFGESAETSEEGMSLCTCRKILKLMNGNVRHIRVMGKSVFVISAEFDVASTTRAMIISS